MVKNKNRENITYKIIIDYIKNKYNLIFFHSCTVAEVLRKYNLTTRRAFNTKLNSKPLK